MTCLLESIEWIESNIWCPSDTSKLAEIRQNRLDSTVGLYPLDRFIICLLLANAEPSMRTPNDASFAFVSDFLRKDDIWGCVCSPGV
jgi:hypothetical protein